MTGTTAIDAAARLIGESRSGRSLSSLEYADLFISLNAMLQAWSQDRWAIHQVVRDSVAASGVASYTMGPTFTINTTRPIRILSAQTINSASVPMPAEIITAGQWAERATDDTETGDFAELIFPDYAFSGITIRVFPKVNAGSTLVFFSLKPLSAIALIGDAVTLPPGYDEALVYNFAVKIAAEFGKQAPPDVVAIAERSRAAIAATNAQILTQEAQ